jgi:flagellar assembly protein FliH
MSTPSDERREAPFMPLMAPQVAQPTTKPIPVNWFETIAPELNTAAPAATVARGTSPHRGSSVPAVAFEAVDAIASREQSAMQAGTPEPAEIIKLRHDTLKAAEELMNQSRLRAQEMEDQARARGYEAGYSQGFAAGEDEAKRRGAEMHRQSTEDFKAAVQAFVTLIEHQRAELWVQQEPLMIDLVFELTRKVIKMEVDASHDVALAMVQNTLRRVANTNSLRIRINPDDLEAIREHRDELLSLVDGLNHIDIIEDRRVDRGGCIADTSSGTIDARVNSQLEELGEAMQDLKLRRDKGQDEAA